MHSTYRLSPQQIEQYHRDGYLHLPAEEHQLVDPTTLRSWTTEVQGWPYTPGKWLCYEEPTADGSGKKQLFRTEAFVEHHAGLDNLLCGEALRTILAQISGDEMLLFKDKINYKLPNSNGFKAHLDSPAYDHIGRISHLTANIAVDAGTPENGCLEVVPGSHKMSVPLAEGEGGRIDSAWEKQANWVQLPLRPGDIVLFGSHLAHRSAPNRSTTSRASIYATYHCKKDGLDLRERYYADRRVNFPPEYGKLTLASVPCLNVTWLIGALVCNHRKRSFPRLQRRHVPLRLSLFLERQRRSRRSSKLTGTNLGLTWFQSSLWHCES